MTRSFLHEIHLLTIAGIIIFCGHGSIGEMPQTKLLHSCGFDIAYSCKVILFTSQTPKQDWRKVKSV